MAVWRILVLGLALSACATSERISEIVILDSEQMQAVQQGVKRGLPYPDSAIFLPVSAGRIAQGILVCGNVSTKSGAGSTSGFRPYRGVLVGSTFTLDQYGDETSKADRIRLSCLSQGVII